MATKNLNLGIVPVSRGEFNSTTIYYKDNIVQYKRGSYQVISESPIIGVSPTNDNNVVNPGWTLFAGTLDAQDVVDQIKEQEAKSIQAVADREAEILAKSDAAEVSFDNTGTSLSGTNVQDALKETDGKLSELETEVIYDVTANNNGATFISLSALLSSENLSTLIPTSVRHGGISIRFVRSSDNRYVHFRCITNEFSTNPEDWVICDDERYIENPEFIAVYTDKQGRIIKAIKPDGTEMLAAGLDVHGNISTDSAYIKLIESPEFVAVWTDRKGRILFGVQNDGNFYFGAGIPQQVVDYINKKIAEPSLDVYEDIVAFLNGLEEGDKTLQALLNEKVDKIEGKSLINSLFANSIETIDNPEFIDVEIDSKGRILGGRKSDGTKTEKVGLETPSISVDGTVCKNIEDVEERLSVKTDSKGLILSFRDKNNKLHELSGFITPSIEVEELRGLNNESVLYLEQLLKESGFTANNPMDWSDYISNDGDAPLHLPTPRCAIMNLTNDAGNAVWPQKKFLDLECIVQFWDMQGNYFKKKVFANAQGNSSLGMPKKNLAIDLFDEDWDGNAFSVKFGDWIPQDSFHIKAYYADYFVGVCPIGYKLFDQIVGTRDIFTNRDWKKALLPDRETIGIDCNALSNMDDKYSLDNDARCYPDSFPVICFLNGIFYGVFSWQIKKHRDNYMMSKKKPEHIHLDGCISDEAIFLANGNLNWDIISAKTADSKGVKDGIEIRNPKPKSKDGWILTCADGTQYDGDTNMNELMGQDNVGYDSTNNSHVKSNQVKQALIYLSTRIPELQQMEKDKATSEAIRTKIKEYFDIQSFIDYIIFSDIVVNSDGFRKNWQWITWDGKKWFIEPYDLDGILGWSSWSPIPPTTTRLGNNKDYPTGWIIQYYQTEIETRYAELRNADIITTKNIVKLFQEWIAAIGTDNFQRNHNKWPNDKEHYGDGPVDTHYDSIYRISNWLDIRIAKCDEIYNYRQN